MIDDSLFRRAAMESRDGITISDMREPDQPLVFVNPAFERMTGYKAEEILGRNCRFLQGESDDQPQLAVIREALAKHEPCLVTLLNHRRDSSRFWNELSLSPIFDTQGELTHYIGIQKDVTTRILQARELHYRADRLAEDNRNLDVLTKRDHLTGVYNRRYFDDQIEIQWNIAARSKESVSVFLIDLDNFKAFNDRHGHLAGDNCLQRVATQLNRSFRRSSDFVARYGGEEFIVLALGMTAQQADAFAAQLCERVRELGIDHPDNPDGLVTISIGYKHGEPIGLNNQTIWLKQADMALYRAKKGGRNRYVSAD